jgi:hypothetical protein
MDSSGCRKLVMITGQNVVADDTNRVESVSSATIFSRGRDKSSKAMDP